MVECWEEKSVAMAMAVLRIWHTKPDRIKKRRRSALMHSFASLNLGRLSSVFLSPKDFTYQYPSPPHKYIMKSRFWKFCFFPFQEVFFFSHLFNSLRWYRFFSKLPVGRCWWLPGTHHDRVTTLGAAALRPVTRACWEAAIRWSGDIVGCALWS